MGPKVSKSRSLADDIVQPLIAKYTISNNQNLSQLVSNFVKDLKQSSDVQVKPFGSCSLDLTQGSYNFIVLKSELYATGDMEAPIREESQDVAKASVLYRDKDLEIRCLSDDEHLDAAEKPSDAVMKGMMLAGMFSEYLRKNMIVHKVRCPKKIMTPPSYSLPC
jgi:hypothetical protein